MNYNGAFSARGWQSGFMVNTLYHSGGTASGAIHHRKVQYFPDQIPSQCVHIVKAVNTLVVL